MIVKISENECEFRNTPPGIKKMFAWIDESMKELEAQFSHLVVDGSEVFEAPLDYVKLHLKDIREIEVIPLKKKATVRKRAAKASMANAPDTIHVKISNIDFTVQKSPAGVDEMFSRIDDALQEFQVYFSHLLVDGSELTVENPRRYLADNLGGIKEVEVCFLTAEQFFQQVTLMMDSFLQNSLPTLKVVADDFYGRPDDETWRHFNSNIEGIASMLQLTNSLMAIKELSGSIQTFDEMGRSITIHLENLQNAARLNDYTMMADIMHFELVPFMENLHTAISDMVRRYGNVTH